MVPLMVATSGDMVEHVQYDRTDVQTVGSDSQPLGTVGPQRKNWTEEKAKVVAAVWGTFLNATLAIQQQGCLEEKFLEEHSFWEGGG